MTQGNTTCGSSRLSPSWTLIRRAWGWHHSSPLESWIWEKMMNKDVKIVYLCYLASSMVVGSIMYEKDLCSWPALRSRKHHSAFCVLSYTFCLLDLLVARSLCPSLERLVCWVIWYLNVSREVKVWIKFKNC